MQIHSAELCLTQQHWWARGRHGELLRCRIYCLTRVAGSHTAAGQARRRAIFWMPSAEWMQGYDTAQALHLPEVETQCCQCISLNAPGSFNSDKKPCFWLYMWSISLWWKSSLFLGDYVCRCQKVLGSKCLLHLAPCTVSLIHLLPGDDQLKNSGLHLCCPKAVNDRSLGLSDQYFLLGNLVWD